MLDLSNIWPEWKAVELIGEGSFGKVYKCVREDEFGVKSESAIKVISIPTSRAEYDSVKMECASDEEVYSYFNEVVLDFTNEIKLMLMLKGAPNIVSVENYKIVERKDELGWDIYILMEYLTSFAKYSINKTFTEKEVKKFALDVLGALEVCEKNNIIHRDIKPVNIFVDRFGMFKLGDFGVARQLEGSVSMMSKKGTAKYMAPEVYRGEKYDRRVDFYSLGLVMYKLLNRNRDPFIDINKEFVTFKERSESLEKMRRGDKIPAPVDASADMAAVILKACEYRPEDRFADVEQFRKALNNTLINDDLTAKEETKAEEKTIVAVIGDTTASMNGNDVTLGADEPTMLDEPTVIADEPTVMAEEPTVLADELTMLADDEATVVAPENEPTMLDEPTALADDEPTVVADEPTVIDENRTVAADIAKSEAVENKPETEEKKDEEQKKSKRKPWFIIAACLLLAVCVAVAVIVPRFNRTEVKSTSSAKNHSRATTAELTELTELFISNNTFPIPSNSLPATNIRPSMPMTPEEETYLRAEAMLASGNLGKAAILFGQLGNYSDARQRSFTLWREVQKNQGRLASGAQQVLWLNSNGTVDAYGIETSDILDVGNWNNIVAIAAGYQHSVGLKSDGTVVATGNNTYSQCDVYDWYDIVDIDAGSYHTVGLTSDGYCVAVGGVLSDSFGQTAVYGWSDIIDVAAGDWHTVGLRSDGIVAAVGDNIEGQCDVDDWTDIVAVSAGWEHTVGLRSDGTVVAVGNNEYGQCDVEGWTDIIAVSAGEYQTVGLKSDGTVVATGDNSDGQCNVGSWTNVIAVDTNSAGTIAIRSNGSTYVVGGILYEDE